MRSGRCDGSRSECGQPGSCCRSPHMFQRPIGRRIQLYKRESTSGEGFRRAGGYLFWQRFGQPSWHGDARECDDHAFALPADRPVIAAAPRASGAQATAAPHPSRSRARGQSQHPRLFFGRGLHRQPATVLRPDRRHGLGADGIPGARRDRTAVASPRSLRSVRPRCRQCSDCPHCGKHQHASSPGKRFDPKASSTSQQVQCAHPPPGMRCHSCDAGSCSYGVSYTEGSSIRGRLVSDVFWSAPPSSNRIPRMAPTHASACHSRGFALLIILKHLHS